MSYILQGINCGLRVGFNYSRSLSPAQRNMPSTKDYGEVVESYLAGKVPAGRIIGPLSSSTTSKVKVQTNRLGDVPKGRASGKRRIITDLLFLESRSINDGIDPLVCSLRYTTVDKVAQVAGCLGVGTLLAKLDVRSAYHLILVHPDDHPLLGFQWQGVQYVDGMLPFGLRSAPKIFTAVTDALEWVACQRGVSEIDHYLDNFVTLGPLVTTDGQKNLDIIIQTCADLGVPLAGEAGGAHNMPHLPGY